MKLKNQSAEAEAADQFHPLLLLLFVASGCAALIYEVVWFHMLRLVIGASAPSLAIVLTSFLGGLCVGSLGFSRYVPQGRHPLSVYGLLEGAVAVLGVAMLVILPALGALYFAVVGYGATGLLLRAIVCGLCLLPPTVLMGATLPAIARLLETSRLGVSRLGLFYAANTAGGVFGCLAAGFYLLRVYDIYVATFVAVALNVLAAAVALVLSRKTPTSHRPVPSAEPSAPTTNLATRAAYLATALSGLTALGAEAVWTRQLSMVFGSTVFSFTIILAIFLVGITSGSAAGSIWARFVRSPALAFALCQIGLVAMIPIAAHMISMELPYWHLNPQLHANSSHRYIHDLLRASVALLPAACLWGASFPLALAAAARGQEPGRLAGNVYATNTIGSIVGALLFSLVMIPAFGSSGAQQILAGLAGVAALILLATASREGEADFGDLETPRPVLSPARVALAVLLVVLAVGFSIQIVPAVQPSLIAFGRQTDKKVNSYPYVREGVNASIAVGIDNGFTSLHVNGKTVASNVSYDLRLQRMLGHYPALFHPKPRSVLVVGMGSGTTAGSFVAYPEIERIVICEIEPLVLEAAGTYFKQDNLDLLNDPRVEVVVDDARHYIAATQERFDIITSDPIHPWMDGAAALFSTEYYELAKEHLNPGGIVVQWVPAYETDLATVRSELATFLNVFPQGSVWNSHIPKSKGNDFVMIGHVGSMEIDVDSLVQRIEGNPRVQKALEEVDLGYTVTFLASFVARGVDLRDWLLGAEINHDRSLRLQYLAGRAIDETNGMEIYRAVATYRRFPEALIKAPRRIEQRIRTLWQLKPHS
jgi:spermidine synthase